MSENAGDITIAEDAPVEIKINDAPAAKILTEDDGFETVKALKEQVERSRQESQRRLSEADRRIEESRQIALNAQREVVGARKDTVTTVMESLTKDKEAAKRDLKTAYDTGNGELMADAQDRLSLANARLVEADRGRLALEEQIQKPTPQQQQRPQYANHVEQFIADNRVSGPSAAWIRNHPEYIGDRVKQNAMEGAHNLAVARNIHVESPEYFKFIEQSLGIDDEQEQPRQQRQPTAAPVRRDIAQSPMRQRNTGAIRLSPEQQKAALEMNLDPKATKEEIYKKYAKNLVDAHADGKVSDSAIDWR